jgi:hypothetical protein
MTTFKVGDRVKVAFEGTVTEGTCIGRDGMGLGARVCSDRSDLDSPGVWYDHPALTLIAPVEPKWQIGDAIMIPSFNEGVGITLTKKKYGDRWVSNYPGEWSQDEVSERWAKGDVLRLVPEESK